MALAPKLAIYDDLLALPEDTRVELLAGEIVTQPSPSLHHQLVQDGLSLEIGGPFQRGRGGPGGWYIVSTVDVRFTAHDVICPDKSGWRRERLHDAGKRPIDVVPDWICEILSPSNFRRDRGYKSDLYATHGVGHLWLIDPVGRQLEAYALQSGRWLRIGAYDETIVARIPPFEAVELSLAELFPPLDLPPLDLPQT